MYQAQISRANPGCIVFLLDRSASMGEPWAGSPGLSLAEGAAQALNRVLYELCLKCVKEPSAPPRRYFDVGVFGYGQLASSGGEGVESALSGDLAHTPLVSLTDLATHYIEVREVQHGIDLPPSKMPIWVEPVFGERTPMCQAISTVGAHVADWVDAHRTSYPPIVINVTDGMVTDSPYQNASLEQWAERLRTLSTNDGPVLFLNVFLSSRRAKPALFPNSDAGLPDPGPLLYRISSPLPPPMLAQVVQEGYNVQPNARALAFNADMAVLIRVLETGTRSAVDAIRA